MSTGCSGDFSRRPRNCLAHGHPRTAIDDHPARIAFVSDNIERNAFAVSVEAILSGFIATAWSTAHRQFNFRAEDFPITVHFGPAIAFECERAGGIESRHENAEG